MQRSRPSARTHHQRRFVARLPLAVAICFAMNTAAFAQATPDSATPAPTPSSKDKDKVATLESVTVTAQKRKENLQKVPISIQVLDTKKLTEMNVKSFDDYAKLLPSLSYSSVAPGFGQVYMRGVSSGGDGNHSGPLPSVGIYVDEEPITTIDGAVDLHIYDIARVEALSGPQGTLYGASSQSGTLRIITNKPDPTKFSAGYSLELNGVSNGGVGGVAEGFFNQPINDHAAIRLVAWKEHDAGWIDNVEGSRTYPVSGITVDNGSNCSPSPTRVCTHLARDDANTVDITGARAALRIDLNDNWTITPTVMGQHETEDGNFASDSSVGKLALKHFYPDLSTDQWVQAALTVEGKIGNFDITYAFADLNRHVEAQADYSDYSFWYDTIPTTGYGNYIYDNNGTLINPSQYIQSKDVYHKVSHELRIASPKEDRLRFIGGVFWQQQLHDIQQRYRIDGLSDDLTITGWPGTLWLTKQVRRDDDSAVFGELSFDFTKNLTGTIGGRYFRIDNSLEGFFGFSDGFFPGSSYGEASCGAPSTWVSYNGAPCKVFAKQVKENGSIGKANLTWQATPDVMLYGTWSEGFRPGGINRRGTLPPYTADFLTNWELGWKTTWFDHKLSWNGAVFLEKWKDFQFAILGANGLTEIKNANQAEIKGFETQVNWAATYNLHLTAALSLYNPRLTANYCGATDANGTPITDCPVGSVDFPNGPEAPSGTQLPLTAKIKGNVTARYTWDIDDMEAYVQGSLVGVGRRTSDLRLFERGILGDMPGYGTVDLSTGIRKNGWAVDFYIKNAFDKRAAMTRFTQCAEALCGNPDNVGGIPPNIYTVYSQPRSVGLTFSQEF